MFGKYDTDIVIEYTMNIAFVQEGGKELLYDEIPKISSIDLEAKNDVMFPKLLNNKINNEKAKKKLPSRNNLKMT